jgi:hypothetical protein
MFGTWVWAPIVTFQGVQLPLVGYYRFTNYLIVFMSVWTILPQEQCARSVVDWWSENIWVDVVSWWAFSPSCLEHAAAKAERYEKCIKVYSADGYFKVAGSPAFEQWVCDSVILYVHYSVPVLPEYTAVQMMKPCAGRYCSLSDTPSSLLLYFLQVFFIV